MPSEKKKCGACKDKLTREGYAKEQWQKEENERRCLACVAADRPNTAAQTPEEKAERDAFVKACVEALSRRSDVTNHTRATEARRRAESVDAPTEDFAVNAADVPPPPPPPEKPPIKQVGPSPSDVLKSLCYDYPDVRADQCAALAKALRKPADCNLRIAARAVEGIQSICEKASAGSEEAELALSIAVTGGPGPHLPEGNRARVCAHASRVQRQAKADAEEEDHSFRLQQVGPPTATATPRR